MSGRPEPLPGPVRRLLVSHALASVGMSLPWPLLLVLVFERAGDGRHGDLLLGLTAAARMLPYVLLSWATGMLADRFPRDRLVRATLAARVLLLLTTAGAVAQGWLAAAVVSAALAVACGTPAYPAIAAALPAVAGPGRRRATDALVTIEVASFVVGPAVGGLLLAGATRAWSPLLGVLMTALAAALVADVVLPLPVRERVPDPSDGPTDGSRRGMLDAVRGSRAATRAIAVAGLLNAVDAVLMLALLPMTRRLWHGGDSDYGLATGILGFGALAAPLLWRLGSSNRSRASGGLLLLGAALAVLPLTPALGWAGAPLLLAGAATVHVESAVTGTIQDAVPDAHRAGALGLTDSVMVAAALAGSLAAPWLASVLGPSGLLVALAVTSVSAVPALGRRTPARLPARDDQPARQRTPAE